LLLGAAGIATLVILSRKNKQGVSLAGQIGEDVGEASGQAMGGVLVGNFKGFWRTVIPGSIRNIPLNIKNLGDPDKWWS
jgi:hypothetical protein